MKIVKYDRIMMPRPPIWMSIMMTNHPQPVKWTAVSTTMRPVTQTAEVAVKSASMNGRPLPSTVVNLIIRIRHPVRITTMKLRRIVWAGWLVSLSIKRVSFCPRP